MIDQAMEGARLAGASRIIGVDINPAKYEQGITKLINAILGLIFLHQSSSD
jgi:Zn-dependent alcohol dehydrogenase